jgi:hypothetical protein
LDSDFSRVRLEPMRLVDHSVKNGCKISSIVARLAAAHFCLKEALCECSMYLAL